VPRWVTPLPSGLFGGETLHVYAGFASPPQGAATLTLVPAGPGQVLGDTVALPAAILDAPSLPRMAAALRIESAGKDEALSLALRHQLLTAQTNCVIVHERAEGEKATDLPQLQKIAQMHAAGWGGVGTVHANVKVCRSVSPPSGLGALDADYSGIEVLESAAPILYRRNFFPGLVLPPVPCLGLEPAIVNDFLQRLEAAYSGGSAGITLPDTIAGIVQVGCDREIEAGLNAFVDAGDAEDLVVRAFLEALLKHAGVLGVSRQLQRALRHQFANAIEHAELRRQVASWVDRAIAPLTL
jgi:Ca-activated chloride channel family protein